MVSKVKTVVAKPADLAALHQVLNYWSTSPGFDSRWGNTESDMEKGHQLCDRFDPDIEALGAVVALDREIAKLQDKRLAAARNVDQGRLRRAVKALVPDDDTLLSVHDDEATPGLDAERLLASPLFGVAQ